MEILKTQGLKYGYMRDSLVLKGIDAAFERGRIYAILGASGCGKTTLLSLLGGLDTPTEGVILFDGKPISDIGFERYRREDVSFVFQNYNLIDYMTAAENVRLVTDRDPAEILNRVGLTADEQKRNVLKLSGGQQQRVAIARALASSAPIILADEPTGNLDEDTADEIMDILVEQSYAFGKCTIIVTHAMHIAQRADVILNIRHGLLATA